MICDHPRCTGYHRNVGPADRRCPATQAKRRACQARYKTTAKGMLTDIRWAAQQRGNQ